MSGERIYLPTGNELGEIQLPASVVTSNTEALGEVEGSVTPAGHTGSRLNAYAATVKGNVTFHPPTGVPTGFSEATVEAKEDPTGNHSIAVAGLAGWTGSEPVWNTAANAVNLITMFTTNGGATWHGVGTQTGATGPEGPEGFEPRKLWIPNKVKIFKGTGGS
jgi:hypothetical protein